MKLKKPKFWDLKKPNFLAYLLYPLTIFMRINNILLKYSNKKKFNEIKSICVGNIYLGGTGKTPLTLSLFELLEKLNYKVLTAKKFYPNQLDEQILLKKKSKFITLRKRVEIVEFAIKKNYNLVIFDDGLQDKQINFDLKFVCFDIDNWIGNGCLIPSGPLREKIESLKRFDAMFLKITNDTSNLNEICTFVKNINPKMEIFQTNIVINNIDKFDKKNKYLIFSGIGNSESFRKKLREKNIDIVEELIFPDHYDYTRNDVIKILNMAKMKNAKIITTEKDHNKIFPELRENIGFIEISLKIKDENKLTKFIQSKINEIH